MTALVAAYMGTVTAAVVAGASLSQLLTRRQETARLVEAFSAGVMLAVCLLYLIPDALAFQHGIVAPRATGGNHVSVGYALSLGFLSLLSIERYLLGGKHHAHGSSGHDTHGRRSTPAHSDPQHHAHDHDHGREHGHVAKSSAAPQRGIAWSAMLALWLHGIFDGVALYAAGVMPAMGTALAIAIILHKVPESATLLAMLRRGGVTKQARGTALLMYLLATPVGMIIAAQLLKLLSEQGVSLLMAFVAGSLLHLVTGHLLPEVTGHAHSTTGEDPHAQDGHEPPGNSIFLVMLAGFSTLVVARLLGAD